MAHVFPASQYALTVLRMYVSMPLSASPALPSYDIVTLVHPGTLATLRLPDTQVPSAPDQHVIPRP